MGAYSGTILDKFNPLGTMNIVHGIINDKLGQDYGYDYNTEEVDALRHYITMQAIADKYGTTIAGALGKLWEGPEAKGGRTEDSRIQREIDLENNMKALEDYEKGNILEFNYEDQLFDKPILDSLLQEITIPPKKPTRTVLDMVRDVSEGIEPTEKGY